MACDDLGQLAQKARIEPEALAATVFEKVTNNSYGIYDGLVVNLAAALGQKGRAALRRLLLRRRQQHLTALVLQSHLAAQSSMGLAICRSIIEAHGGRLWATKCEPRGALFQFTIPVN